MAPAPRSLSVLGDSTHGHPTETPGPRLKHSGRFHPKCIAAAGLVPAGSPRPRPHRASGSQGPCLPPAGDGDQRRGRGPPGAATLVPLGSGWKRHERRPLRSLLRRRPLGATASLCHCSQQRKHVTVGPKHLASPTLGQWGEASPFPEHSGRRSSYCRWALRPPGFR